MAQNNFSPGDLVKLSSGSPVMTVSASANGIVTCVWFDTEKSKFETTKFVQSVLVEQQALSRSGAQ